MVEELRSHLLELADVAARRKAWFSFLRVMVENSNLGYDNLLLLYGQKPSAGQVCGRKAWEHLGRHVKEEATPIKLLLPRIRTGQGAEDLTVHVYDRDSTGGDVEENAVREVCYGDVITGITGATWELVENGMQDSMKKDHYDVRENIFYLTRESLENRQGQTEVALYVEYLLGNKLLDDPLLQLSILYVLYEHYEMKHTIVSALFGKLERRSPEEKLELVRNVQRISRRVIQDFEGYTLDFSETAMVNDLLVTDEAEEMWLHFDRVASTLKDEDRREELLGLKRKLMRTRGGYLPWLCRLKQEKAVYTYPPVPLELDNTDYLREERQRYYGGWT